TTLEIGGRFLAFEIEWRPTFKRAHNKLFNAIMARARRRVHGGLLHSSDMRSIIRYLQDTGIIWFAPDQDFGRRGSVFAPFMGVATSTLTMTSRLAKKSDALVLPMYSERLPGKEGYLVRIGKALDIPSNDEVKDATAVNKAIEEQVRRTPAQYLWGHRRFKTRPYGEQKIYQPKKQSALRRYDLLLPLISILFIFHTVWMSIRCRDFAYLTQRLGISMPKQKPGGLWFHAASVGEVNAVMPLIIALNNKYPQLPITLTSATPTGGEMARKKLPANCVQHFLPVDWAWAVNRLINSLDVSNLVIMETELWPKLFWANYKRNVDIIIINGRLSKRSQPKSKFIKLNYMIMMQQTRFVLARSSQDAERFIEAGIESELVKVMGNIKYAPKALTAGQNINIDRPYVLLASSRDNEERQILEAFNKANQKNILLVIVPRHPKRLDTILKQIEPLVNTIAVRSKNEPVDKQTQVYIADTFGELPAFIAGSEFVIMGGSFAPFGGQNIIEVGQQSKAVIFGPHMDNFADEAKLFIEHDAGIQVQNLKQLTQQLEELFKKPDRCQELGANGKNLLQGYSHIIDDYMTELETLLPRTFD
ncbi:MAG: hypothetical protein OEY00_11975, partial [Gammaproteobacteria bacterium]|nr:hypothetical protein [Gammaproteobacteria bacterium]